MLNGVSEILVLSFERERRTACDVSGGRRGRRRMVKRLSDASPAAEWDPSAPVLLCFAGVKRRKAGAGGSVPPATGAAAAAVPVERRGAAASALDRRTG